MKLTNLKTNCLGTHSTYFNEIDSTQKEVWRRIASETIQNGEIVIANLQTSGIGTHGRRWHTDEGENIAFTVYFETNCDVEKLGSITIDVAQIMQSVFKDLYNVNMQIKEPNDLVINGKKVGGILTESKVMGSTSKFIVLGIGINTNKKFFNDEIVSIATSVNKEYGIDVDNASVIAEFCNRLEETLIQTKILIES